MPTLDAQIFGDAERELTAGAIFAERYTIERELGRGGMGAVYLARQHGIERLLALKTLHPDLITRRDLFKRFFREAQAVSRLSHPNIVQVFDFGVDPATHRPYIAMEFLQGQSLAELQEATGPMSETRGAAILEQVARALVEAHSNQVIHRDLKPENILVRRLSDGTEEVKVLDFGIAKVLDEDLKGLTATGAVVGTPMFMSPEQALGKPVSAASDLYALGCILHMTLTGAPVFDTTERLALMVAHAHQEPKPLPEVLPSGAPPSAALIALHRALLAKKAAARPQSAAHVARYLGALARGEAPDLQLLGAGELRGVYVPTPSTALQPAGAAHPSDPSDPQALSTEISPPAPSGPSVWLLIAVAALVAGLVTGGVILLTGAPEQPGAPADPAADPGPPTTATHFALTVRMTNDRGPQLFPALSADGVTLAYSNGEDLVGTVLADAKLYNLTNGAVPDPIQPAFSPDGTRLAFAGADGLRVAVLPDPGGGQAFELRRLTEVPLFDPAWSPDGRELVATTERVEDPLVRLDANGQLRIVDTASGEIRALEIGPQMPRGQIQPSWSPSGRWIAFTGGDHIHIVSAAGGTSKPVASERLQRLDTWAPQWVGDYLYMLAHAGEQTSLMRIRIDGETGEAAGALEQVAPNLGVTWHVAVSADGTKIVYATQEIRGRLARYDLDPATQVPLGAPQRLVDGPRVSFPDVDPAGTRVVVSSVGAIESLGVVSAKSEHFEVLGVPNLGWARGPRWAPEGERIAFYGGVGRVQGVFLTDAAAAEARLLVDWTKDSEVHVPVWSPDGTRLALTDLDLRPYVLQLEPLALRALPGEPGWYTTDWSPDGAWLAVTHSQGLHVGRRPSAGGMVEILSDRGYYPLWLSDSRRLLVAGQRQIWVVDAETRAHTSILELEGDGIIPVTAAMTLSSDDRTLFLATETRRSDLWSLMFREREEDPAPKGD